MSDKQKTLWRATGVAIILLLALRIFNLAVVVDPDIIGITSLLPLTAFALLAAYCLAPPRLSARKALCCAGLGLWALSLLFGLYDVIQSSPNEEATIIVTLMNVVTILPSILLLLIKLSPGKEKSYAALAGIILNAVLSLLVTLGMIASMQQSARYLSGEVLQDMKLSTTVSCLNFLMIVVVTILLWLAETRPIFAQKAAPAATPTPAPQNDAYQTLTILKQRYESGVITKEAYETAKENILKTL